MSSARTLAIDVVATLVAVGSLAACSVATDLSNLSGATSVDPSDPASNDTACDPTLETDCVQDEGAPSTPPLDSTATPTPASIDSGATAPAPTPADAGTPTSPSATSCIGTKPGAQNTGVPAGVSLTVVNQDVVVTTDGTVIDAQDIRGFLTIKASNVRVTRSIIRGRATSATTAVVRVDSGTNILIEDTEISVATPVVGVDGLWGGNVTARRLNVHGGVDGMKLDSNDRVECSWIHGMAAFASDPNIGGGPTHNDAIQILSGSNIQVVSNTLEATSNNNAAVQITEDFGQVSGVRIEGNWADGGGCTFNFSHSGALSLSVVTTRNNRFGRNSFYGCPILKSTKTTLDSVGDVFDDDGTPVPVQTHD